MINLNSIGLAFGAKTLFEDVNLFIDKQDKIGLVGKNGAGKTTLFKIIKREVIPDEGKIDFQGTPSIGHLKQELDMQSQLSVFEECGTAFEQLNEIESRLEEVKHGLQNREDYETEEYLQLCEDLAELEERFSLLGGHRKEKESMRILKGLGFSDDDMGRPMAEFSGGWQMRVELAKLLLRKPSLLLLDEPTNHLDIDSIRWLEEFLRTYEGAVVLISHDRNFLDTVTKRTIEIMNKIIFDYPVSYSAYKAQRAERLEQLRSAAKNQEKQIAQTERFIERFRAKSTKARQVQSKIKQLDKVERITFEEDEVDSMNLQFPEAPRSARLLFKGENISKSYDGKSVFNHVNFEIERGERIAFIGRNGMGKSTLTKILMGLIDYDGTLEKGQKVIPGYFAQDNITQLKESQTAFQVIDEEARGEMRTQVRSILGAFLFSGEEADKKVSVLSGGEKSRLSLAKLLLQQHNFLVLDEPTNHLDMRSKDILKDALLSFNGTYVVVSHDRDFLRGLATKVFAFVDGKVEVYLGGIDEYLKRNKVEAIEEAIESKNTAAGKAKSDKKSVGAANYEERKVLKKERNKKEKHVKQLEEQIERMEAVLKQMESSMSADDFAQKPDQQEYYERYEKQKSRVEEHYAEWERLTAELDDE